MSIIKKHKKQLMLNHGGFTLIELMVIVVVLGILAAVASTRIKDISGSVRVSSAINQITSDIELVKEIALANHEQMSITYNQNLDNCTFQKNGSLMTDYPGSNNGIIDLSEGIFSGVDITQVNLNGSNMVNIDKWGNVLNSGTITLNNNHIISIEKLTGFTEVTTQ